MSYRPYSEEPHVVSDTSRFHHNPPAPRNRSRNASPLNDEYLTSPFNSVIPKHENSHMKRQLTLNYEPTRPNQELNYAKLRQNGPPSPPSKPYNQQYYSAQPTPYNTIHLFNSPSMPRNSNDLPPEMEPAAYQARTVSGFTHASRYDLAQLPYEKQMEQDLVQRVMNPPVWTITRKYEVDQDVWEESKYTISTFTLLHSFESVCAIILVILASILIDRDSAISSGYYKYLLSDLIVTLAISIFFITKTVAYESRNGVLYCLVALTMKLVSFIIVIVVVVPNADCPTSQVCSMRRTLVAFIIIGVVLWLINCVAYLTTLYISRLDIISIMPQTQNTEKGDLPPQPTPAANINDTSVLKEYYLDDMGEMKELTKDMDVADKQKVIVYF